MMDPFPFQQVAIDKLTQPKLTSALVGDEMGLGKTVTAIFLDIRKRELKRERGLKTLIVAPLAVTESWERHLRMIAPKARVVVCSPKNRDAFVEALELPYHYYIIHWEGMRLLAKELQKLHWFHIIGDEVHRVKNRKAQVTKALKYLKATHKLGLSGTPADDKPTDLWSILNWLWPSYYRSYWKFVKHYAVFDTETNWATGQTFQKFAGVKNANSLHAEMGPWFVRRLKEDVLKDLPDKYYSDVWVELYPKQRKAYDQMKEDMITWVGEHQNEVLVAPVVIAQLTRLQQFALGYMEASTTKREVPKKEFPEREVWNKATQTLVRIPAKAIPAHTVEDTKWRISNPSSKLDALMSIIQDNPDEQIVVFSQFKAILRLLGRRLSEAKIPHGLYTGDVPKTERDQIVNDFQDGRLRVFAGTIAAGGEGITLTAASTVVFLDRSWKPTANLQAEDRLHRIGQKNAVHVIDIMAKDTVDLGRRQRIKQKWEWLTEILGDARKVQEEVQSRTIEA